MLCLSAAEETQQTCTFLRSLIRQRDVWIRAIRSFSALYGAIYGISDLEGLDVGRLQRIALGPLRWQGLLQTCTHASQASRKECPTRLPKSTYKMRLNGPGEGEQLLLLPGGRFVLYENVGRKTLKIWDLGLPGARIQEPFIVAQKVFTEEFWEDSVSVHGEFLRVVLILEDIACVRLVFCPFLFRG